MITSKQNALVKKIRSLSDKKYRDVLGLFIVEGIKPVNEAIALNLPIERVICTEKAVSQINGVASDIEIVSDEVFKYLSEEITPQGALAIVEKPENQVEKPSGKCILLDGVQDPSNVGAIIRTAAASGYNLVYLTDDSADAYSQKAVRSSMGGIFRVKTIRANVKNILSVVDIPIIVADMNGENVFDFSTKEDFCLVIGNEGKGVSKEVKSMAKYTVKIPMENGVESLNAAVSAGILMYSLKN